MWTFGTLDIGRLTTSSYELTKRPVVHPSISSKMPTGLHNTREPDVEVNALARLMFETASG